MPTKTTQVTVSPSVVFLPAIAFSLMFTASTPSQNTVIWNPANGHTYITTSAVYLWHEGRALAGTYGGHLATINDSAEQAWIQTTFQATDNLWIGLTDELQSGVYAWDNGEAVTYTNWCPGEPNSGGNEDFGEFYGTSTSCPGRWNDVANGSRRVLIEIPTSTSGQPAVGYASPNCGPRTGGTAITIRGFNFTGATTVSIGGVVVAGAIVVNASTIIAVTLPGNTGLEGIAVTGPAGTGVRDAAFAYLPTSLPATAIANGGFEAGPPLASGFTTLEPGNQTISPWTIISGAVDLVVGNYWQHAQGQRSLDLNGNNGPGAIQQTFSTIPQRLYLVVFQLAGSPNSDIKGLRVQAAGQPSSLLFDSTGFSNVNMGWVERCAAFTANSTSTTLRFSSLTAQEWGPAIDDVRVIEFVGPLHIDVPHTLVVGTPLVWNVSTNPPAPSTAYLFDISFDGDTPGLAVPPPLQGPIPLNPTFLHFSYRLAFPQLFSGFIGLLDATGQATPVLFTPFYAGIVGQDLYAACITFDPFGPLNIGLISNGERTTFVSPAPTVSGVVPGIGTSNGGDPVTVTGSLFLSGATVTFGGAPATNVQVVDSATITCQTPPRPGGPADVVVSNPGGVTGTLPGGFTYFFANPAPTVGGINPPDGPVAGNSPVVVSGAGFVTGAAVTIGGAACTGVNVLNSTTIVCQTPPGTLGTRDFVVTNPDTQAGTFTNGFTYIPNLTLTSVFPLVTVTGAPITLQGAGFQTGHQLSVGPMIVTPTSASATQIVFPMPAGAACSTQVTVANPSTQTSSLGFNPSPFVSAAPGAVGPASGGGTFLLIGNNFFPGTTATVGGAPATIQSLALTAIFAIAPPGTVGNAQIVVTSASGCTATSTYLYQ